MCLFRVNKDEKYVPSFKGKALLIDFGYSFPVPNDKRDLSDNKATLHDLADEYDVSAERIRQIENAALKKLKSLMVDFA